MNKAERIAALERALAAIEAALARVEAALPAATRSADLKDLNTQLSTLKSERFNIGNQLANLRASEAAIAPLAEAEAQRLQALSTELDKAIVDRGVGSAAIDFASSIIDKVRDLADGLA